jgi:hypothetical protein
MFWQIFTLLNSLSLLPMSWMLISQTISVIHHTNISNLTAFNSNSNLLQILTKKSLISSVIQWNWKLYSKSVELTLFKVSLENIQMTTQNYIQPFHFYINYQCIFKHIITPSRLKVADLQQSSDKRTNFQHFLKLWLMSTDDILHLHKTQERN